MTRLRAWLRADDGTYLAVLLGTVALARTLGLFWPDVRVPGQTSTTTWAAVGIVVTFVAWVAFRPRARWDWLTLTFLGAVLAAWAGSSWVTFRHDDVLDLSYLVVPVALVLVAVKRPSGPAVTRALDVLAWATALLCLGMLVAQQTGLLDKAAAGTNTRWDATTYWVPLSDPLGFSGRWIGPFLSPNNTAVVAVFLVVWGAARGFVQRIFVMGTGALVLVLTGSRTSTIVAALGVALIAVLWPTRTRAVRTVQRVGGCLLGVIVALGTALWVVGNPTLSGRTSIWPVYFDLWRTEPAGGVGDSGVGLAVEDGRLPGWATVAHSIYLEPLARDGIVVALLVVLVLVLAVVVTVRAARRGRPVGLALVVALLVGGITETLFDWRYLGYQVTVLVGAVLVSSAYLRTPGRVVPTLLSPRRPRHAAAQRRADAYVALDAAAAGAEIVRSRFRSPLAIHEEPREVDVANDVDLAALGAIRRVLDVERPDDAIVDEEPGRPPATGVRAWLVDPLSGTVNFAAGLPLVCTNVALTVNAEVVAAAVADPMRDERYWTDGASAWRWTGTSEDVRLRPDARSGSVAVGSSMTPERTAGLLASPMFADRLRPVMVATSLAAVWVADGRLAAFVDEERVYRNPHYAAGFAIACAAGCVATDLRGKPLGPDAEGCILAADPATHAALLAAVADMERGVTARTLGRST